MKKTFIVLLLSFGIYAMGNAQTTSAPANSSVSKQKDKANKEAIAAQKKADKQAKAAATNSTVATDNGTAAAQKKADRGPKVLAKKQAKAKQISANQSTTQVQATPPATTSVAKVKRQSTVVNPANTDKVISTDAKGRSIYQGPRGGKYYIDKNGKKEYVK